MTTIIDKSAPPSPILEWHPKPEFKNDLARQKYWQQQKEIWIEGIGEIPGTLAHKTQEQKIKNRNTGEIFRPICRDVDLLVHQEMKKSRDAGEALVIIKGRGIGLSCEMGGLANYFMRCYPGSTSLFTSSEQTKISALFSEKVMTTFNEYDLDIRPTIVNKNETKNMVYLKAEIKSKNKEGQEYLAYSEVFAKQTSDDDASASGFSGKGAIFGAFDEIYLHRRRSLLLKSSSSCFIDQSTGKVVGFLLCGGSVEETLTNEELVLLQMLIDDVQKSGRLGTLPARLLFIASWWGKFMVNGHSNEKKAMEWWNKEIEALDKLEDKSVVRAFRMNNPMSLQDIFDLASGSFFEEDVMDKIKLQLDTVRNDPEIQEVPHIIATINGVTEAKPDKKGKFLILEPPKDNVDYIMTVDGVGTGKKYGGKEGSLVASLIWKMFDAAGYSYCPVALYYEKPETVEQSYMYSVELCRYFDRFGNFKKIAAEGNMGTGDHFSTHLEKEGLGKWILYRKDLSGKGHSNKNKSFQYVTSDIRSWQIRQMNIILRKYIGNVRMKSVLMDWMKGIEVNADIRDSSLMFPIYAGADFDKRVEKPKPRKHVRPHIQMIGGRTVTVWS